METLDRDREGQTTLYRSIDAMVAATSHHPRGGPALIILPVLVIAAIVYFFVRRRRRAEAPSESRSSSDVREGEHQATDTPPAVRAPRDVPEGSRVERPTLVARSASTGPSAIS